MIAPDQEALVRFFHTSNHDCIEESSYTFNTCVTVEQGVNERISVKWALVVDGRARLVTTEFFFVCFFACMANWSCCVLFGFRYPFRKWRACPCRSIRNTPVFTRPPSGSKRVVIQRTGFKEKQIHLLDSSCGVELFIVKNSSHWHRLILISKKLLTL